MNLSAFLYTLSSVPIFASRPFLAAFVTALLARFGTELPVIGDHSVLLALDGEQALTIAGRMIPDVILLDALMPNLDGFETCKALKADPALQRIFPVWCQSGTGIAMY